jgi:predicted nucleic acid-binding Zn ribbon protein
MDKEHTQSFSNAFQQFLKSENLEKTFLEKKLIKSWEQIMGKPIASRTHKLTINKEVLYVYLSSAPLKQELSNSKDKILERIEEEMGAKIVTSIKFM